MSESRSRRDLPLNIRRQPDPTPIRLASTTPSISLPTVEEIDWGPIPSPDTLTLIRSEQAHDRRDYWQRLPHLRARIVGIYQRLTDRYPELREDDAFLQLLYDLTQPPVVQRRSRRS